MREYATQKYLIIPNLSIINGPTDCSLQ